jgi:hypothetical protein
MWALKLVILTGSNLFLAAIALLALGAQDSAWQQTPHAPQVTVASAVHPAGDIAEIKIARLP